MIITNVKNMNAMFKIIKEGEVCRGVVMEGGVTMLRCCLEEVRVKRLSV